MIGQPCGSAVLADAVAGPAMAVRSVAWPHEESSMTNTMTRHCHPRAPAGLREVGIPFVVQPSPEVGSIVAREPHQETRSTRRRMDPTE